MASSSSEESDVSDGEGEPSHAGNVGLGGSSRKSSGDVSDHSDTPDAVNDETVGESESGGESETGGDSETDGQPSTREDLSRVSFEELQKLQSKIGTRKFNELMAATGTQTIQKRFKRDNKNRPMEISSKRPVKYLRQVIPVKKKINRDPRFDDLSGTFNETYFKDAYSFIGDLKSREKEKLKKQLRKEHDPEKKAKLSQLLKRMSDQEKREAEKEKRALRDKELKKEQIAQVRSGHKPYFLKKSDKKVLELADKYKKLKDTGSLETYMAKKRKKNASRDRKLLPAAAREESS